MLAAAARRGIPGFEPVRADALAYLQGCPAGSFDLVTAFWCLPYIDGPELRGELRRVLRPGGVFVFAANTTASFRRLYRRVLAWMLERPTRVRAGTRLACPRGAAAYRHELQRAGFSAVTAREEGKLFAFPAAAAAVAWARDAGLFCGYEAMLAGPDWERLYADLARGGAVRHACRYVTGRAVRAEEGRDA
jgi:SAM-dependent methyltransferase